MKVIGIHDMTHNSSVSLVEDGKIISVIEEERFTGNKFQRFFPFKGLKWILEENNLSYKDIDYLCYDWDTKYALFNYFKNISGKSPFYGRHQQTEVFGSHFIKRVSYLVKNIKNRQLMKFKRIKTEIVQHHLAHASSAFRCSGFKKANILIIDATGERDATSLYIGNGDKIELLRSIKSPNSLGLLYQSITDMLNMGFHGEGKTMGLASYGKPNEKYLDILSFVDKYDYKVNWKKVYSLRKEKRIDEIYQNHRDMAASLQYQLEQAALRLAENLYDQTGYKKLCLAGGCALNCVMNGKLLRSSYVKDIFIQPAADDGGTSLGAALEVLSKNGYKIEKMMHNYYGPSYDNDKIKNTIQKLNIKYEYHKDIEKVCAELLSKSNIIGWFQGRLEIGPRALGNRSVLADPTIKGMNDKVNEVKHREKWRPLAPSVTEEDMNKYFEDSYPSPYMILNFYVKENKRKELPAVTHVDGTARIQSVSKNTNPRYHKLIKEFTKLRGVPILVNTSFNDKGQPMVRTPYDAIVTAPKMKFDYLVLGNYLINVKDIKL